MAVYLNNVEKYSILSDHCQLVNAKGEYYRTFKMKSKKSKYLLYNVKKLSIVVKH